MKKPFAGIRILDFTRYVAGPFGTYQLALLGAEVIKIEPKSGDEMRHSQLRMTHLIAGFRLDLDHLGAKQRELIGTERPGDIARKIEDADAGKGFFHHRCSSLRGAERDKAIPSIGSVRREIASLRPR